MAWAQVGCPLRSPKVFQVCSLLHWTLQEIELLLMALMNADNLSASQIAEIMKMGSWRLGRSVVPQIELLVSQIEMMWREHLSDLKPSNIPEVSPVVEEKISKGSLEMLFFCCDCISSCFFDRWL